MGPPTVNVKAVEPGATNTAELRQGSIKPKIIVQTLSSNNSISTQQLQFQQQGKDGQRPSGAAAPQNQRRQSNQAKGSIVPDSTKPPDGGEKEGGILQNITNIFKKSSSSSEASLAGLNAALVHRLYDPADLAMQDDKGRRYSHRAMHYLGDRIEDTDLCFITLKPRGLPADCTIKGNYVTVHRQNVILGPKGSQIEKVRLPVLKPEKTQSDDDNLILLPGPSQYEATHHLVNPDDPEGYTEYLKAKAEWEKIRPASVSSGTSARTSEDESKLITKNVVREKLLKEKEEKLKKVADAVKDQKQEESIVPEVIEEPPPSDVPTEEIPEIPAESQEIPETPAESEVPVENAEVQPVAIEAPAEVVEENKENADGDNANVPPEVEPVEVVEKEGNEAEARMFPGGDIVTEPADTIEEKAPEVTPPPEKTPPPAPPPPLPQLPKVPINIKTRKSEESIDESDSWLPNGTDDDSGYDYYGSGGSVSYISKSHSKSKPESKKPKLSVKIEKKITPEFLVHDSDMGNGMMNPMMGGMNMMNPMMMNPMMGAGMNPMMGGPNGMDPFMMGIMMGMIPYLSPVKPEPPPAYPSYPPPPCYGYDYYGCGNYCCPPPCNNDPCCYDESPKKCCKKGKSKCKKKDKKNPRSKCHKKEKYSVGSQSKSTTSTNYTATDKTRNHSKRSEHRNKKIALNKNQNLNLEEDMNFEFLPQKGCCAEVTMTMDPDEPDPLLYAVTNNCMPVVCCQIPPTLVVDQPKPRRC